MVNLIKEYSINGSIVVSKTLGRCSNHLALEKILNLCNFFIFRALNLIGRVPYFRLGRSGSNLERVIKVEYEKLILCLMKHKEK